MFPSAFFLILGALPLAAQADTIYLCKAYSGGMFWSDVSCGQRQATVDRMVSVPDGIPWDQKVALGEVARKQGQAIANPRPVVPLPLAQTTRHKACANILAAIENLNGQMAVRRAGPTQDRQQARMERLEARRKQLMC